MKIRPRNIPKYLLGNNIWYKDLTDFDPNNYESIYNTSLLVNGDMTDRILSPWKSNIPGYDLGRYTPTSGYGSFGEHKGHYNYTLGVEKDPYYKLFGVDLIDLTTGKFTPMGEAWARSVDALLPPGSNATFYDPNTNQLRTKWTTEYKDAHGRSALTFDNLKDYVNYVRNDLILGARHNVFLKEGKRYFYTDAEGNRHWVDPNKISGYNVSESPIKQGWEGTTYWNDYELTGPKNGAPVDNINKPENESETDSSKLDGSVDAKDYPDKTKFNWDGIIGGLQQLGPNLLEDLRLGLSLNANQRIYDASLKGIRPNLMLTYLTHRLVVGDEATKQAYYRRAAAGQTKAAQPFTSDADRQIAYQMEAKRIGDELRAQGDLADNAEIRRTSDESNQHQWANTQRRTEVANLNVAQINAANLAKLNLLALKYAADHSSWDNFLKGREYRWRQRNAENKALEDLIWTLLLLNELANDETLRKLKLDAEAAYDNKTLTPQEKLAKIDAYLSYQRQLQMKMYQDMLNRRRNPIFGSISFVKSGTKLTYKRKDDLLYKSARDVVEHFRKMTKLTDDSYLKSRKKTPKLTPHPTKKLQQGGVAPFTVFTPVALGGEYGYQTSASASTSSGKSSSSSKENEGKDTIELIKKLFEQVSQKGLPIDVDGIYLDMTNILGKAEAFGRELSTHEIATMYLRSMQQLNLVLYNAAAHKDAKTNATQKDALNEVAIDNYGLVVVQDVDTRKINYMSVDKAKKAMEEGKGIILTNDLLLDLRAISPQLKFDTRSLETVNSGIGMSKVTDWIKNNIASLGSTEETLEGYTKRESDNIKSGLRMLQDAPEGVYKTSDYTKTLKDLVEAAVRFLSNAMPDNMQRTLKVRAELNGIDPGQLIIDAVAQRVNYSVKHEVDAMTGKAAKDSNGNSKSDGDSKNSAGLAFVLGQGPRELISFNTGTSNEIEVLGIKGVLLTKSNENLGQGSTLLDATKSQQGGYLQWNKATFGGSKLNPSAYSHIILNDSTIIGMDLPYTKDLRGNEVPDFLMLRKMEQADEEIRMNNITDINNINLIYVKYGLSPKYTPDGKLNLLKYKRFAAILATLDERALESKDAILSDEVLLANEVERDLYEETLKKSNDNKKYSLSDGIFGIGRDELYKGTIFIPYDEDISFAALSSGEPFKLNLPDNVSSILQMLYSPKASQYISPQMTLSQLKNN